MSKPVLYLSVPTIAFVLAVSAAHAAFTTDNCLAQKRKAQGDLQQCRAKEEAKQLQGKSPDVAKCTAKFQEKIGNLSQKARDAAIACRYRDNGDGTVTDYDTGLQWEKKDSDDGVYNPANPHDVDNMYSWTNDEHLHPWKTFFMSDGTGFLDLLNGKGPQIPISVTGCFAGHCDWRLPSITEHLTTLDENEGYCADGSPAACIDPAFGPTNATGWYWSSTTKDTAAPLGLMWASDINFGAFQDLKVNPHHVRAVRGGL